MQKPMIDGVPRRNRFDRLTPAEKAIREAVLEVEKAGAHPLLTEAVVLLAHARSKVADFVDLPQVKSDPKPGTYIDVRGLAIFYVLNADYGVCVWDYDDQDAIGTTEFLKKFDGEFWEVQPKPEMVQVVEKFKQGIRDSIQAGAV